MKFIKLLAFGFAIFIATSNTAFSQSANLNQQTDSVKTILVKVKGINCSMDLKTISTNVEKLKGVSSCKAGKQGTTTNFEVQFNSTLISEKEIFSAIEGTSGCENPDDRPYKVKK